MFGLGVPELLIILVLGLIIFGPGKLPDVGRALGKSIREFKSANKEPEETQKKPEIDVTEKPKELKGPKDDDRGAK